MKNKRFFLYLITSLVLLVIVVTGCSNDSDNSDDFPAKPVKIVVAYSPGGSSDRAARLLQPYLEEELGANVVVENMPGASGQIAATNVLNAKADGYTILAVNSPGIYYTMAIDGADYTADQLLPLWVESNDPIVLITKKEARWENLSDFVEDVKENPGELSVGVAAGGGQQAVAMWLKNELDLDLNIVNYDGGGPASAALLGDHVDAIFGDAYARMDLRDEAKCLGIADSKANEIWPEGNPFNEQLAQYGAEELAENFQARFGTYWVNSEFREEYPERYNMLVEALEKVAENEEYQQKLVEMDLMDSMVLKRGSEYEDYFKTSYEFVEEKIAPLFK